ncbi:unnamed protein product [Euphydryas editha]|uniref:Uncharacterized protein n=2 Tax=Euphydryas editha TaxID=104508 RepID=A0AAU9V9B5_EUPED|nr:unnamed protein product [Euphydryas editha]
MPSRTSDSLLPQMTTNKVNKDVDEFQDEETIECDEQEICYGAGDALFSAIVVAPQVISVWRGTWGIMELQPHLFPHAQTFVLGNILHISFALIRSVLLSRSKNAWGEGRAGKWLRERFVCRIYTYIFILANIMHWRGGWGLLDLFVVTILPEDEKHR